MSEVAKKRIIFTFVATIVLCGRGWYEDRSSAMAFLYDIATYGIHSVKGPPKKCHPPISGISKLDQILVYKLLEIIL